MLSMSFSQAATAVEGRLLGKEGSFASVSTDSRTLSGRPLFVALLGERFDGHAHAGQAVAAGAVALLVQQQLDLPVPQILVADTRLALGKLASAWRQGSKTTLIGLTGSNGKTTLKEMLRAILKESFGPVLATEGNLNNDIGVPLTLLRLRDEPVAVVEMGANHAGEIAYLSDLARPDVAVLNNAGRAHLEGFGSEKGVAMAKGEILSGLNPNGWFVYHADSPWAEIWRQNTQGRQCLSFGFGADAQVRGMSDEVGIVWQDEGFSMVFEVMTPRGVFPISLSLAGRHNQLNALAAVATALCLDLPVEVIQLGLKRLRPVKGRLHSQKVGGCYLVDDGYNANPDSLRAAIRVLVTAPGRRFLVLGDMAELGVNTDVLHQEVGEMAKEAGLDGLLAVGARSALAAHAFGKGGQVFDNKNDLVIALKRQLQPGDAVLIKGSRSAAMDEIVAALKTGETN